MNTKLEAARYAFRERFAIVMDNGGSEKRARKLATLDVEIEFRPMARSGALDFQKKVS